MRRQTMTGMFGLIGGLLARSADSPESVGKLLRTNYAIEDPVLQVQDRFKSILTQVIGLHNFHVHSDAIDFKDEREFRKR